MSRWSALLGFAAVLTTACASVRARRDGAAPLAIVHVGNFSMRLRPEYRFDGGDGPSLALYPDGTYLRERLVDGEVKLVRGRISQEAAAGMIDAVTRCVKPLAAVTEVATATIRFHPQSMMLVLRPAAKDPIVRVVVDVEAPGGQIALRDSAEHQAAVFGDADHVDLGNDLKLARPSSITPEPEFWTCLRPLLHISSDEETPWTPATIALVLANARVDPKGAQKWPQGLSPPPRPRDLFRGMSIRHDVPYSQADVLRSLLRAGEAVEVHGYVWSIADVWVPWPGERR
jgi:hypothetical protein